MVSDEKAVLSIKAEIIGREDWFPNNEISGIGFSPQDAVPAWINDSQRIMILISSPSGGT
jgi:hypothetical protein